VPNHAAIYLTRIMTCTRLATIGITREPVSTSFNCHAVEYRTLNCEANADMYKRISKTVSECQQCSEKLNACKTKIYKISELMIMRRARAFSSSCSQVILVYFQPFCRNSLFRSQKSPKTPKTHILGFKGNQDHQC